MKIPEKVKIGGYIYGVKYDDKLALKCGSQGTQCANTLEICIDSNLPTHMQESVLMHEIIEAINYHYELKLEHRTISIIESALFQIIQDNSEIFQEAIK